MIEKEYIYPGSIKVVERLLFELQVKNILLVRGNQSYIKSGAKEALSFIFNEYNVIEFSEFSVNPKLEEAQIGFELFKQKNVDAIVAIGGGSVIDTAKIIKYLAIQEDLANADIPFIVAPTTAGTGSEATHFTVVYIHGVKYSWAHESLIPTVAIIDAELLNGQSKYQIAVSGLDAFAQGIESFWSVNSTDESLIYSEKAIRLIWENLESAINGDKEALIKIAKGSNWAGKAINITKTTAAHALSYSFTSKLSLPHGHAVVLFIPYFIQFHKHLTLEQCNDYRGPNFVKEQIRKIAEILNVTFEKIEDEVFMFFKRLNVEVNFDELEITDAVFSDLIKDFSEERMINNPGKVRASDFKDIYLFNLTK